MRKYSKREVALIAELLADKLIRTYQGEQIDAMVDGFASAGFTKTALEQDPAKLFQMLVIAAYDRRPFAGAAGGFEVIWGIRPGAQSIPQALQALSLFTLEEARHLGQDAIHRRLDGQRYCGLPLATDGEYVRFARTLLNLVQLVEGGFHSQVLKSCSTEDVQEVYANFDIPDEILDRVGGDD